LDLIKLSVGMGSRIVEAEAFKCRGAYLTCWRSHPAACPVTGKLAWNTRKRTHDRRFPHRTNENWRNYIVFVHETLSSLREQMHYSLWASTSRLNRLRAAVDAGADVAFLEAITKRRKSKLWLSMILQRGFSYR